MHPPASLRSRTRRAALAALAAGWSLARAQTAGRRVARVGWLGWSGDTSAQPSQALDAFRDGLAAAGWRAGDNLTLDVRHGDRDQAAALAAELVRAGDEVIVAQGPMAVFGRGGVGAVPMVFSINGDPVPIGLVSSLARPGGSATGITALSDELSVKRVELIRTVRPGARRVALLANISHPGVQTERAATEAACQRLGLATRFFGIAQPQDLPAALAAIAADHGELLVAFPDTLINRLARPLAEFHQRQKLPSISGWAEYAQAGNLLSYGPVYRDFFRQLASFTDRILRGARPADLPVERPTRFELVVNRRAAQAMGLTLPADLVLRADEVIG